MTSGSAASRAFALINNRQSIPVSSGEIILRQRVLELRSSQNSTPSLRDGDSSESTIPRLRSKRKKNNELSISSNSNCSTRGIVLSTEIIPFPGDPSIRSRVIELEDLWTNAMRNAFGYCPHQFDVKKPWEAWTAKQRGRWWDFNRMVRSLGEWGADPRQFVAAIVDHFKKYTRKRGYRRPNPRTVAGTWGRGVWESWKNARVEEWAGSDVWAKRCAAESTASVPERFKSEVRKFYNDARASGVFPALSISYSAELLWVLWMIEPVARKEMQRYFDFVKEDDDDSNRAVLYKRLSEIAKIRLDPSWQTRIMQQRHSALGTNKPLLES